MNYGSLSKSKYTSNNITALKKQFKSKDISLKMKNSNTNTLSVDKDVSKNLVSSFRPGVLNSGARTKFKTTERIDKNFDNRNFSGDRKQQTEGTKLLIQNYLNSNTNKISGPNSSNNAINPNSLSLLNNPNNATIGTPNKNNILREIVEEGVSMESLMKNKILKKKDKIKTNLLNFSNPYTGNSRINNTAYYKIQLETSGINSNQSKFNNKLEVYRQDEKEKINYKNNGILINNHKRSNSTYEEDDIYSQRQDGKKTIVSPRMESIINKYYDIFDKKKEYINAGSSSTSMEWKKNTSGGSNHGINPYVSNCANNKLNITNNSKFSANNEFILNSKIDLGTISVKNNAKKYTSTSSANNKSGPSFTSTQKSLNLNGINLSEMKMSNMTNSKSPGQTIQHTPNNKHEIQASNRDITVNKQNLSKTTVNTKSNSRKNSIEKTLLKNSKNFFLAVNKNSLKASINTSTNNSSSTLLSNNQNKYQNFNNINIDMDRDNAAQLANNLNSIIVTEQSQTGPAIKVSTKQMKNTSGSHNKGLSEIPILSSVNMNILNNPKNSGSASILSGNFTKNFLYNNNLKNFTKKDLNSKNTKSSSVNSSSIINNNVSKKKDDDYSMEKNIKNKLGPVSIAISTIQSKSNSKNNSKNNSKSVSRIEDFGETPYSNIYLQNKHYIGHAKNPKSNSLIKKYIPITTSHSPTNLLTKEVLIGFGVGKKEKEISLHADYKIGNANNVYPNKNSSSNFSDKGSKEKDKALKKINLEINNIKKYEKEKKKTLVHDEPKSSLEMLLNNSSDSIKSTIRESNYYRREADKVSNYIKQYYHTHGEYPKTNSKLYKYGRLLGRGAFGKVNLGLHIGTGRLVAIKSFNKSKLVSDNSKRKIIHETNILKNMKHNSIVKIYETFETSKYILIVMEYVCCGDLLSFVRKRSKLNENIAKFIFKQIIEGLQYIHSQNIVHRDVKLDNILIDLQNNIKICDFGVSKQVKKGDVMHDQCGTPAYIAPEILKNQGYEGYGVDIWSAGVVLYAMLSGTVPFKANNMNDLHKLIIKGSFQYIKDISEDAQSLMVSLLEVEPKKRITIDQILCHPWVKSNDKSRSKMNLFTAAEKILLAKSNLDYRNANKDELIENFTLKNLDSLQETENQNINTKSIILAPFNSSFKANDSFLHRDVNIENDVLKLCGKVKELNRNYELNNNGEIDNGIIISPLDENVSKQNSNTPFYSPYSPSPLNNSFNNNLINNKVLSKPISPAEYEDQKVKVNSPKEESIQKNLIKNGNNLHTLNNKLAIDEKLIREVEELGYRKEFIIKGLLNNDINYATASYYLLLNNCSNY